MRLATVSNGPGTFFFAFVDLKNRGQRSLTPTQPRPVGPWRGGGVSPYAIQINTLYRTPLFNSRWIQHTALRCVRWAQLGAYM